MPYPRSWLLAALGLTLALGTSTTALAQDETSTYRFESIASSAAPAAYGNGEIIRTAFAMNARGGDGLLLRDSTLANQQSADLTAGYLGMTAIFRFHELSSDALYTIVASGASDDDPNVEVVLCRFQAGSAGRGDCSSHVDLQIEPATIEVRQGDRDGSAVLRSY